MQPYPLALDEADAEPRESLLDAMAAASERNGVGPSGSQTRPGQGEGAEHLEAALQQSGRRARKRCQALERQLDQGDGSAALR